MINNDLISETILQHRYIGNIGIGAMVYESSELINV